MEKTAPSANAPSRKPPSTRASSLTPFAAQSAKQKLFALAAGLWLALSFVKLGNPVIFDKMVGAPQNLAEIIFVSWPVAWGYLMVAGVIALALTVFRFQWRKDHWPIALLGLWLFWQLLSSTRTVDRTLTNYTLPHFLVCALSLLLGWCALARVRLGAFFWTPILLGFLYSLFTGFDQHNGGLETMRKAFYEQPDWQSFPPEYIKKLESNRIFGTFVYPNAFAGGILLLLPAALWQAWNLTERWHRIARGVLLGLLAYLGLACLYWTGSKGGWLIALVMLAVAVLHFEFPRRIKIALVTAGLLLGLLAFFVRFSGYFEKGATSVGARFTYWTAAVQTIKDRPLFGSGPGTFSVMYAKIRPPEAEMAKLTHNDYLQQFSDSGILGGVTFTTFILASLALLYKTARAQGWGTLLIWLGLLGWSLQAAIEFTLYIPAIAWLVFTFFGYLYGQNKTQPPKTLLSP
ncbi:MAG TPA: O-antigen ligase family protein [Verrucomicrobiae bacterium]